ncbi:hypothetical protein Ndes2526B_g04768 [Nannochloris sp. 'desiccata']|nr:putative beta-1,3-galactosyltransferase 2 [Chlorella desiccata (nom. nud.)]
MRPYHRGNGGVATSKLWLTISFVASFYVVGRLWSASTEINYLQDELETVTKLAREQKERITLAEEQSGTITEPIFYSVRPHPPKNIPSLKGKTLNLDDTVEDFGSYGDEDSNSAQFTAVIAEIDLIEAGTVTGWTCSFSSDVPGPINVVIYVDRVQVADVTAVQDIDLPAAARFICNREGNNIPGAAPKGFVAKFPALPQGTHLLRAFVQLPSGKKVEAHHSPAAFIESAIEPDGTEQLRRKDAIILRRNAELVSILEEFKTKIPWRKAEAAAIAEENRLHALGKNDDENESNRLLALILVHSEPKDHRFRALARKTWVPSNPTAAKELREKLNIAIKFITSMPAGPSLQEPLRQEQAEFQDLILIEEDNVDDCDAKKVLAALSLSISNDENLDSDFYVVTRDTIVVDLDAISKMLDDKKSQGNLYMGCMKSGDVVSNILSQWDEPDAKRFGVRNEGGSAYPVHATKEFYVVSRYLGRYLARGRSVLHSYKFEDTTMGAWLVGLEVNYVDDGKFCCSSKDPCMQGGPRCVAYYDSTCNGMCEPETEMKKIYNECVRVKS